MKNSSYLFLFLALLLFIIICMNKKNIENFTTNQLIIPRFDFLSLIYDNEELSQIKNENQISGPTVQIKRRKREPSPIEDVLEPDYAVFEGGSGSDSLGGAEIRDIQDRLDLLSNKIDSMSGILGSSTQSDQPGDQPGDSIQLSMEFTEGTGDPTTTRVLNDITDLSETAQWWNGRTAGSWTETNTNTIPDNIQTELINYIRRHLGLGSDAIITIIRIREGSMIIDFDINNITQTDRTMIDVHCDDIGNSRTVCSHSSDNSNVYGSVTSGLSLNVDSDYAAALGSVNALADCNLTPTEIDANPEAVALRDAFIASTAAQLGVDPSTIQITGIHTDGDQEQGCSGDLCSGVICPEASSQCKVRGTCDSTSGLCLRETNAADGTPCDDGFETTNDDVCVNGQCIGTAVGEIGGDISVTVDDTYASALGEPGAFSDCYLSPEEIASDPEAAAFLDAFITAQAAQLGVDPSTIQISGIHTDGDQELGCNDHNTRACAGVICPEASSECRVQGVCDSTSGLCRETNADNGTPCSVGDAGGTGTCHDGACNITTPGQTTSPPPPPSPPPEGQQTVSESSKLCSHVHNLYCTADLYADTDLEWDISTIDCCGENMTSDFTPIFTEQFITDSITNKESIFGMSQGQNYICMGDIETQIDNDTQTPQDPQVSGDLMNLFTDLRAGDRGNTIKGIPLNTLNTPDRQLMSFNDAAGFCTPPPPPPPATVLTCVPGQYNDNGACTPCVNIQGATNIVCTTGTDQSAIGCSDGYYLNDNQCQPLTTCSAYQYESVEATPTGDRQCSPCVSQTGCATSDNTCLTAPGNEGELVCTAANAGFYLDGVIANACSPVDNAQSITCSGPDNSLVGSCQDNYYLNDNSCVESSPPAINCDGEWQPWGTCSKVCGSGEQSRVYQVSTPKSGGGQDCEAADDASETQICNTGSCQNYCQGQASPFGFGQFGDRIYSQCCDSLGGC